MKRISKFCSIQSSRMLSCNSNYVRDDLYTVEWGEVATDRLPSKEVISPLAVRQGAYTSSISVSLVLLS